jgi:hypothetical protein
MSDLYKIKYAEIDVQRKEAIFEFYELAYKRAEKLVINHAEADEEFQRAKMDYLIALCDVAEAKLKLKEAKGEVL